MSLSDKFKLPKPKPVTHVIFDMDGLLIGELIGALAAGSSWPDEDTIHILSSCNGLLIVTCKFTDSELYYTIATNNITERYGKEYTWSIKEKCMGVTSEVVARTVINDLGLPITPEEYISQLDEEYQTVFSKVQMMPGVKRLLDHLKKHNIPMAIATSSKKSSFELKVNKFGPEWLEYFHHVLLAPEEPLVKMSKPAPDTFLVARDKFDPPLPDHSSCLVLEDAPFGALAGCRAGMQVVLVPDPRLNVESWLEKEPELRPCQILKSIDHFKPEDFGLPALI